MHVYLRYQYRTLGKEYTVLFLFLNSDRSRHPPRPCQNILSSYVTYRMRFRLYVFVPRRRDRSPVTKNMWFYIDIDLGVPCGSDILRSRIPPRYSVNLRARIAKRDLLVALVALAPTHTHRMHETGRRRAPQQRRSTARSRGRERGGVAARGARRPSAALRFPAMRARRANTVTTAC